MMKYKFKLNQQIYLMLGLVFVFALIIQTTRLDSMLNIGRTVNSWSSIASTQAVNPLTDQQIALLNEGKLLLLYDPSVELSVRIMGNTDHMLQYMKKQYDTISTL